MPNEKILIVDDEAAIRLALCTAFKREGMITTEASGGNEALALLKQHSYHLVILDVMMQDLEGYQVLQAMRARNDNTPVLILSGKSEEMDQVLGLGFGADSYLTKPFHITVLLQTAKALIRRSQIYNNSNQNEIKHEPFIIDLLKFECRKNNEILNLTGRELMLFKFFMENPGRVFTKEQLYRQVWEDSIIDDNTITVYVKRLREKIESDSKNPKFLKTIRGIGYIFDV